MCHNRLWPADGSSTVQSDSCVEHVLVLFHKSSNTIILAQSLPHTIYFSVYFWRTVCKYINPWCVDESITLWKNVLRVLQLNTWNLIVQSFSRSCACVHLKHRLAQHFVNSFLNINQSSPAGELPLLRKTDKVELEKKKIHHLAKWNRENSSAGD